MRATGRNGLQLAVWAILLALLGVASLAVNARAQLDDAGKDQVAAGTVLVVALVNELEDGVLIREHEQFPLGSGVLVSADGFLLTNSHVVDTTFLRSDVETDAASLGIELEIEAEFLIYVVDDRSDAPKLRYTATLREANGTLDLAVLQITGDEDGDPLRSEIVDRLPVPLAPPGPVENGDPVHIFGYPVFGDESFTDIGAKTIDVVDSRVRSLERGSGLRNVVAIHLDAAVSGGSSGGAVVNEQGQLIGVVTQRLDGTGGGGEALAIPIDRARGVLATAGWAEPELTPPAETDETQNAATEVATLPPVTPTPASSLTTPTPSSAPVDLGDLLPGENEAPPGLIPSAEGQRSLDEVSAAFANPAETESFFEEWGWRENRYREFLPADGTALSPVDLEFARVGIHRFGGAQEAAAAAEYIAQDTATGLGGEWTPGPGSGDGAILITGQNANGNWAYLSAHQGPYVLGVSTSSPQGDAAGGAVDFAEPVLNRMQVGGATASGPLAESVSDVLATLLPTEAEIPPGLVQTDDRARNLEQSSQVYSDPADMKQRFQAWEWRANVFRAFSAADPSSVAPENASLIAVSIHEFGSADGASQALDYALNDEVSVFGHQEIALEPLGDRSRALSGRDPAGNETVVYIQVQSTLIVVAAISPEGDPTLDALSVAETVLQKRNRLASISWSIFAPHEAARG